MITEHGRTRTKTHCVHGHDIAKAGRQINGLCRACGREKGRAYSRDNRATFRSRLNRIKLQRGCEQCGYCQHPAALQFHHLADKSFNVSAYAGRAEDQLLAEIAKCIVLCANCHAERTWGTK